MCTYVGRAQSTVEVHGRDGEASCSKRTTTQRFYRPMPLLSLYLVLSLSSSSFSLDRQLCADTSIACARLYVEFILQKLPYLTLPFGHFFLTRTVCAVALFVLCSCMVYISCFTHYILVFTVTITIPQMHNAIIAFCQNENLNMDSIQSLLWCCG